MRATLILAVLLGAAHANPPKLRLCTGKQGNNYYAVGEQIRTQLKDVARVELIETQGSWANLAGIDADPAQCDAIIAQDDAAVLYEFENPQSKLMMERVATLYPEFIHIICNRAVGVDDVAQLDPKKHQVLVNRYGSGTYITWKLMGRLNPAYAKLPIREVGLDEGLLKVVDGTQAHCLVAVSGLAAGAGRIANEKFGDKLKLLRLKDDGLHRAVGRGKRPVYAAAEIDDGQYPKLLQADLDTQQVGAVFFLSPEWHARYPAAAKKLAAVLVDMVSKLAP